MVRLHIPYRSLKLVSASLVEELKRRKAWKPGLSAAASIYHRLLTEIFCISLRIIRFPNYKKDGNRVIMVYENVFLNFATVTVPATIFESCA